MVVAANSSVHCARSERTTVKNRKQIFTARLTICEPYQRSGSPTPRLRRPEWTSEVIAGFGAAGLLDAFFKQHPHLLTLAPCRKLVSIAESAPELRIGAA